jgi:hypothetical protein
MWILREPVTALPRKPQMRNNNNNYYFTQPLQHVTRTMIAILKRIPPASVLEELGAPQSLHSRDSALERALADLGCAVSGLYFHAKYLSRGIGIVMILLFCLFTKPDCRHPSLSPRTRRRRGRASMQRGGSRGSRR